MMTDYERDLMNQGVFTVQIPEDNVPYFEDCPMPPKRPVSPYAKFDKFHRKKKRK